MSVEVSRASDSVDRVVNDSPNQLAAKGQNHYCKLLGHYTEVNRKF